MGYGTGLPARPESAALGGFAVLQSWQADLEWGRTPVVVLSSSRETGDVTTYGGIADFWGDVDGPPGR